jgi:hypothetical protein
MRSLGKKQLNLLRLAARAAQAGVARLPRARPPQRRAAPFHLLPRRLEVTRGAGNGLVQVAVADAPAPRAAVDAEVAIHEGDRRVGQGRVPCCIGPRHSLPPTNLVGRSDVMRFSASHRVIQREIWRRHN